MQRACLLSILIMGLIALPVVVQAETKLKISDNSELNLGFSLQTLARLTDFRNPNSNNADSGVDLFLRRGDVRLGGNVTDYIKLFFQTEVTAATDNNASVRMSVFGTPQRKCKGCSRLSK